VEKMHKPPEAGVLQIEGICCWIYEGAILESRGEEL
jgi:hypothetical protein